MKLTTFSLLILFLVGCSSLDEQNDGEPAPQELPTLQLEIPAESQQILDGYANQALKQKVITPNLKEYVSATIILDNKEYPANIRLKGDWTDHIKTEQWSFRIKMEEGSFLEKTTFSIQNPSTRSYMDEWFMHQLMKMEGVLTTEYQFIEVVINGVNKGVYAFEEHFTSDLLASQKRSIAPILKIDESGYWEITAKQINKGVDMGQYYPIYESCAILPFEKKAISESESLSNMFEEAQRKLYAFKNNLELVDDILELDQLAKYYAINDLGCVEHGIQTSNQRWYFNPNSHLLEPIAYDLFGNYRMNHENRPALYGLHTDSVRAVAQNQIIPYAPFESKSFNKLYLNELAKLSSETYLDSIFRLLEEQITTYEEALNKPFDKDYFYQNAQRIRTELDQFLPPTSFTPPFHSFGPYVHQDTCLFNEPFKTVSLKAYRTSNNSGVLVQNFHCNELIITGYIDAEKEKQKITPIRIESFWNNPNPQMVAIPYNAKKIIYKGAGDEDKKKCKIYNWTHPGMD